MRIWSRNEDAIKAVGTIKSIMDINGSLPEELVTAYRLSLASAMPGMIQRFFSALTEQCPEALKYFK